MTSVIFATGNAHKFAEARDIADGLGLTLQQWSVRLVELQTEDISSIVDRKAKEAYSKAGRKLFVEQTSLHIDYLNGFPAGLTRPFLKTLGDDRVCELFGTAGRNGAVGRTTIGYCNGRHVHQFTGEMRGVIGEAPAGATTGWEQFGWSRVFIPEGFAQTLSELGMTAKNRFSMRRAALSNLAAFLERCR